MEVCAMATRKTYGVEAIAVGVLALAAIVFSNLDSTSGLLREAQVSGGLPKMIADLLMNPAFQVLLVLVAIGLGVKAIRTGETSLPAQSAANQTRLVRAYAMEIDSKEFKRHLLATYYMHALQYRDMANADDSVSKEKLEDIRNHLNQMRHELKSNAALLSAATSLEFNEPDYEDTMLQAKVIQNADHLMATAYRKWKAWGGNSAPTPLASGTAMPSPSQGA
jgi:hypothetical protein